MNEGGVKPEEYLYLVNEVLKRSHYRSVLKGMRIEYEDAYQIGAVGLIRAAKDYNPSICEFPAFAVMRIKRELNHHFRHLNRPNRRGHALSLNIPLSHDTTDEFIDTLEDTSVDINSTLTNVMLDKLTGPEKQLLQLLYYRDNRVQDAKRQMKLDGRKYYRILKSLKNQITEILGHEPERNVQYV